MRKNGQERLAHVQLERRGELVRLALLRLRGDAGCLDHPAIGARAAVRDRRLVAVQFHDDIVDAVTGKGRHHVLHRVDPDISFGKRR